MTQVATQPVVSGRSYPVLRVTERRPTQLADFLGATRFVLDLDGCPYPVCGFGRRVGDGVRFYQKSADGRGRDIRVWSIRPTSDAGFCATHAIT